jgi:hypothetical protein
MSNTYLLKDLPMDYILFWEWVVIKYTHMNGTVGFKKKTVNEI